MKAGIWRLSLAAFVVAVLAASGPGAQAQPGRGKGKGPVVPGQRLAGVLGKLAEPGSLPEYYLWDEVTGTRSTPFKPGFRMPKKDKKGDAITLGSSVELYCSTVNSVGQCDYVSTTDSTVLLPAYAPPNSGANMVSQKILFVYIDMTSCGLPLDTQYVDPDTKQAMPLLRETIFGPKGDGEGGHARYMERCSYGSYVFDPVGSNIMVVPIYGDQCLPYQGNPTPCDAYGMADKADEEIDAWIGGEWSLYTRLLHNEGLRHARQWRNGQLQEYGDFSSLMGLGDACPSSAETSHVKLGWSSPAVSINTGASGGGLTSAALPLGGLVAFNLPATYVSGLGNHIRIVPDWLWLPNSPTSSATNLYIDLRVAKQYTADAQINSHAADGPDYVYADKFNIHTVLTIKDAEASGRGRDAERSRALT
ncbi:hypothetical protein HYH03_012125 [Edaphochlamys debaryana]|uniref:Peptidase M11 gametolysin domain-containing protein n=1 Tax=Edaphochlamys debaryana TaxID=47281 RepID=A0A835XUL1_9CHLO|nr:hypothetical protein HYH03_012125 [Edaphochlamys debaryana]|eukprot:KAG2489293.1 hypothetical protein HYH03_012125 [Edaphochlamys debaryana]